MAQNHLYVSDSASEYLEELLKEEDLGTNIRIQVLNPGTHKAEFQLSFCPKNHKIKDDIKIPLKNFIIFIEKHSYDCLKDAVIDYENAALDSQITVKAPNLKGEKLKADATLLEQVNYFLNNEINPNIARHGGNVEAIEIKGQAVHLNFSGGCKGCSMIKTTLKNSIENLLFDKFPMLLEIIDITKHEDGANPYY